LEERRTKILFVSADEVQLRDFGRFICARRKECEVTEASSLSRTLELLDAGTFDALVADLSLSEETVLQMLDRIPKHVPLVLLSGKGDEEIVSRLAEAGTLDYVSKDADGRYLNLVPTMVKKAVRSRRTESALRTALCEVERRIEARTEELTRTNEQLLVEIAERKRAEEKYRSFFVNAPEGIFQSTPDGRFISVNPAMARIHGYDSPQDMIESVASIGRQLYVNPRRREQLLQLMGEQQQVHRFEAQMWRKDGTTFWGSLHVRPVHDENGQLVFMEGILSDVSERKQAEELTRQSEEKYRMLVDNAPIGILSFDGSGTIIEVNRRLIEILGSPSIDATRAINVLTFPALVESGIASLCQLCLEGRKVVSGEVPYITKWGKQTYLRILLAPTHDLGGGVYGCQAAVEDISERKKAEDDLLESQNKYRGLYEAAKRSEDLYRSLLESSPDAVVIYDLEGRCQYVNDSFTNIFGWTREEIKNKRIDYMPESEREASLAIIGRVIDEGIPCSAFETIRRTKDGRLLDVSISGSRFHDHEGKPAGMLVILTDITEKKRLEEQLRQAAKMEAIGQLAGGVAHDFNNLLTAMMGYASIVLQKMPEDASYREQVVQINRAASRAASLTRQLLAFSRKQVLDMKVLNLNAAIGEFVKILRRLIGENLELRTNFDPQLDMVRADPSQIEQILMNLAVNARDAMPEGGKLSIETANVWLDADYARVRPEVNAGPHVMIALSDTGRGIDPRVLSRIFDPFFTTKEKDVGTGLGLSTVYGIVKQHQGHVAVYSEPGRGTTFKIYLPAVQETADQTAPETSDTRICSGTETVLLVEDDEIVRKLASEVLEMFGYGVIKASGPEDAIQAFEEYEGKIDLLLTDVVLPQMDGKTLFEKLALRRPDMKVLFVSGYTEDFIVHRGVLLPGVHFLQKPFTVAGLASKVREVLEEPLNAIDPNLAERPLTE